MMTKPKVAIPTDAEDREINRGIDADPDTLELSEDHFKNAKPVSELIKNLGGRPKLARTKASVTIRYDADVLEAFRASGEGWQTRMNDALKDWLRTHRP
jgi:uncharacterized protein (DUF4415 family)